MLVDLVEAALPSEDRFTSDNARLFIRIFGAAVGERLLIVHGGPDWDHSYLVPPIPLLLASTQVAMFDLRGCGRSAPVGAADCRVETAAEDIGRVADELGWGHFSLLGFSFGGHLALRYVMSHPTRVDRLVLASTGVRDGSSELNRIPAYRARRRTIDLAFLDDPGLDPAEKTRRMAIESRMLDIHDIGLVPAYEEVLAGIAFSGSWMRAWREGNLDSPLVEDPLAALRSFGKPVLVLHGEHDLRYPLEVTREIVDAVPNARLVVIPDVGHMAHFEATDAWARAVADHLTT